MYYEKEFDGIRELRWTSSEFNIDDITNDDCFIHLYLGSPDSGRKIEYGSQSLVLREGWRWYCFSIEEGINKFTINIPFTAPNPEDKRDLGVMVSSVSLTEKPLTSSNDFPVLVDYLDQLENKIIKEFKVDGDFLDFHLWVSSGLQVPITIEVFYDGMREIWEQGRVSCGKRPISLKFPEYLMTKNVKMVITCHHYCDIDGDFYWRESELDYFGTNPEPVEYKKPPYGGSLQWFVSFACNMSCPYCWQIDTKTPYRSSEFRNRKSSEEWIDALLKFAPSDLYLTGGEPTVYKDIWNVIEGVLGHMRLSMTSNLGKTFNLQVMRATLPERWYRSIAFSFHPTQWKNTEEFFQKLEEFIGIYGPDDVSIEMVLHPKNHSYFERVKSFCIEKGINSIFDPYVPQVADKTDAQLETEMMEMVKQTSHRDYDHANQPELWTHTKQKDIKDKNKLTLCSAGSIRWNMDMSGDLYTCMSALDRSLLFGKFALPHYRPIGNIFDKNLLLYHKSQLGCGESFRCSACDISVVQKTWKKSDNDSFGIPE